MIYVINFWMHFCPFSPFNNKKTRQLCEDILYFSFKITKHWVCKSWKHFFFPFSWKYAPFSWSEGIKIWKKCMIVLEFKFCKILWVLLDIKCTFFFQSDTLAFIHQERLKNIYQKLALFQWRNLWWSMLLWLRTSI